MYVLYIIRTRHRQSKLRSIFFETSKRMYFCAAAVCVCICFFYFFSFYWHNFFWAKACWIWWKNGYGCLFVFVCFFCVLSARSLQNSVYAKELESERASGRANTNLCDNFPGVANVLCANYTISKMDISYGYIYKWWKLLVSVHTKL